VGDCWLHLNLNNSPIAETLTVMISEKTDPFSAKSPDQLTGKTFGDFSKAS
jgi:hypothetical protein